MKNPIKRMYAMSEHTSEMDCSTKHLLSNIRYRQTSRGR